MKLVKKEKLSTYPHNNMCITGDKSLLKNLKMLFVDKPIFVNTQSTIYTPDSKTRNAMQKNKLKYSNESYNHIHSLYYIY